MPLPLPLKILALRTMQIAAKGWIDGDESAAEMLGRVATERPFLLLPPLHRVPLRVGNVVELVGPSASAKTHILIQVSKKKKKKLAITISETNLISFILQIIWADCVICD